MLSCNTTDLNITRLPEMLLGLAESCIREPLFKAKYTLNERSAESARVREKYPARIPVICERATRFSSSLPIDSKCKFLIPDEMTLGAFLVVIRRRLNLNESQAIFMYVGDHILVPVSTHFGQIYDMHKDKDNFVYISYASESVFG